MGLVFKSTVSDKSILTFEGLTNRLREIGGAFKDKRRGKNKQYDMSDVVMSAFSVFYLQCPSFLSYQETMENTQGNNNARTLFGIEKIPSDNHTRDLLDVEDPKTLFPIFHDVFHGLEQANLLNGLRGSLNNLLFAFDGVEYHRSTKVHCDQCKVFEHSNGRKSYAHSMVTAVIVKPGCPHVIDLPPEFIVPQDGHDKQDSEHAAIKRWLTTYAKDYEKYGVTILGDDLYSCQPVCQLVLEQKLHFIFTCKPGSHKILYENIEGLRKTEFLDVIEVSRWTGMRREYDRYCFSNDLDLRDSKDALKVNWCELTTTDSEGNILYHNAFITDHKIHQNNVAAIIEDGRARWKTENENNNTLKKQGYNLEHNFGHGDKNLSNVLVTLNLIAFLCHTILAMTSEAYQKIRKKLGARKKFFEHIRTLTHYMLFDSWELLLSFMMKKLKLSFDTT
jgi:hypothetical protein